MSISSHAVFAADSPEHEVTLLVDLVRLSRLTLLTAEAGADKSRVLKSSVMPLLQRGADPGRTEVAVLFDRWTEAPLPALISHVEEAVRIAAPGARLENTPHNTGPLGAALAAWQKTLGVTFVIIFDRFEQYLAASRELAPIRQFEDEFVAAVNDRALRANFLLALDEDAAPSLDTLRQRIPGLGDARVRLPAASTRERPTQREPAPTRPVLVGSQTRAPAQPGAPAEPQVSNDRELSGRPSPLLVGSPSKRDEQTRTESLDQSVERMRAEYNARIVLAPHAPVRKNANAAIPTKPLAAPVERDTPAQPFISARHDSVPPELPAVTARHDSVPPEPPAVTARHESAAPEPSAVTTRHESRAPEPSAVTTRHESAAPEPSAVTTRHESRAPEPSAVTTGHESRAPQPSAVTTRHEGTAPEPSDVRATHESRAPESSAVKATDESAAREQTAITARDQSTSEERAQIERRTVEPSPQPRPLRAAAIPQKPFPISRRVWAVVGLALILLSSMLILRQGRLPERPPEMTQSASSSAPPSQPPGASADNAAAQGTLPAVPGDDTPLRSEQEYYASEDWLGPGNGTAPTAPPTPAAATSPPPASATPPSAAQAGPQVRAARGATSSSPQSAVHTASGPMLYIHVRSEAQRARAERMIRPLARRGIHVTGIKFVRFGPPVPDLRYFRSAERDEAVKVALALRDVGFPTQRLNHMRGFDGRATQRQYELWFPPPSRRSRH